MAVGPQNPAVGPEKNLPIRKRKLQVLKEVQAYPTPFAGGGGGGEGRIEEAVAVYSSALPPLPPGRIRSQRAILPSPPLPFSNLPCPFPRLPDPPLHPSVSYPPPSSFHRKPQFFLFFSATADKDDGDHKDYEEEKEDDNGEDYDEEGADESTLAEPTTSTSAAELALDSILDPEPELRGIARNSDSSEDSGSDLESRHCVSVSESGSIEDDSFTNKQAESP